MSFLPPHEGHSAWDALTVEADEMNRHVIDHRPSLAARALLWWRGKTGFGTPFVEVTEGQTVTSAIDAWVEEMHSMRTKP